MAKEHKFNYLTTDGGKKLILFIGEVATKLGMSRAAGQVGALLFLSDKPLPASDISELLGMSRSTLSGALREIVQMGYAKSVFVMGDRREHYETPNNAWDWYRVALANRKRFDTGPQCETLESIIEDMKKHGHTDEIHKVQSLLEIASARNHVFDELEKLSNEEVKMVLNLTAEEVREQIKKK